MYSTILLCAALVAANQFLLTSAHHSGANQDLHFSQWMSNVVKPEVTSEFFQPPSSYQTYGDGLDLPSTLVEDSLQDTALSVAQHILGLDDGQVVYTSGYSSDSTTAKYAYVKQSHKNIPFVNAVANLVVKDGKLMSFGSSFVKIDRIASPHPTIRVSAAIRTAEIAFEAPYNEHPTRLEYFALSDSVALVHVIQVQDIDADIWREVYVDAHSGDVVSSANFIAEAGYEVVQIPRQSIFDGSTYVSDPQDLEASPLGWHNEGPGETKTTFGNNVVAFIGTPSKTTPQSEDGLVFKYPYDISIDPRDSNNPHAARVNAFYIINMVHDIAYRYGFTETAFNFQSNNFGKGGKDQDTVLMSVQNNADYNNANFGTGPDGQPGICRMYLWNGTMPFRDGDLDNTIVVHEMTHGISNRMTGGGTAKCLQDVEAKGLGEGWSDTMADWTSQATPFVQDFAPGQYAADKPTGSRFFPYSTDPEVNPLRFFHMNQFAVTRGQHAVGQIWANMLHNVYAALVGKYGYSATARTNPDGSEGNIVFLHLFIDSFSTQPCYPTFGSARDAWIQADNVRYKGANRCLLWKVFASRGLGMDAHLTRPYADGEEIPADCKD